MLRRVILLAACILGTTVELLTAERGPQSGTAPHLRSPYTRVRLWGVPHVLIPLYSPLSARMAFLSDARKHQAAAACRPQGAIGGGSMHWRGRKAAAVPIDSSACGGGHCSCLNWSFRARRTSFLFVVLFDGVPVEPLSRPRGPHGRLLLSAARDGYD